ncbi:MAG: DJ-1/PfpI family protein [Sphaerochaetaceae bacterium]|nr:DJ-1/PfpI family protein [Sphaerochaetaceae bacterium]MDD3162755.1 DJ-1/PfpI family protein [Sphaerochaetaceae bacterium]MDD4006975.1 DJ-1/PfpI family protein [Sphaerochaetaceae bacterium]MDD4396060.1 DJ-1/PfpI family protein [Sphaerochaetaceae bacterium]
MKKVLVFLADGFEEVEAMTPIDVLRRLKAEVIVAGVGSLDICSSHGIHVRCDVLDSDVKGSFDCVVLPGGMPGSVNLAASWPVNEKAIQTAAGGGIVAAICAAPAVVLGPAGLLEGHNAVCNPGMESAFPDFKFTDQRVLVSGTIITAQAAGCAMDFSLAIVEALYGKQEMIQMEKHLIAR